jgi:hypothetical protein
MKAIIFTFFIQILFLCVIFIDKSNSQSETEASIKMLACAAISKKMLQFPDLMDIFNDMSVKFAKRINHDAEQTKNFVNLLLLNKCNKNIDFATASDIIKQRADKGDIEPKYIGLLELKHVFNDYISLDDEQKRTLFQELAQVKESLRGLTDSISKMGIDESLKKPNTGGADKSRAQDDGSFITGIFRFIFSFFEIARIVIRENFVLFIGVFLILLISFLGNCKIRRKKKNNKKDN